MELINFDTDKSLEMLDAQAPSKGRRSIIVARGNPLRKKPVRDLTLLELRTMIGQNSSLKFLVPLAIQQLHVNSLVKGDVYEGDLLNAVLTVEKKFWVDDLKGCIPMLESIIEIALAAANADDKKYAGFLRHCTGAINIFKKNVGLI
jgi:hypothetical protein